MSPGVRQLTVIGKFKPFGLIAETTDGKPPDDKIADSYQYFLFDPELTGQRDDADGSEANFTRQREHELFIRGNRYEVYLLTIAEKTLWAGFHQI